MPRDTTDIVTFGIPLISRAVAHDWSEIERLFNATLASLYNQTDANFRIIVASNGRPSITVPVDDRLQFIDHPRPLPKTYLEKSIDGGTKRWEIATRHVELGGGNLMFVDADDLVSAKLVEFIRRARNPNGCIITDGYVMNAATGAVARFPLSFLEPGSFHRECATCVVMNLSRDDLTVKGDDGKTRYQRIYGRGHPTVLAQMIAEGRPPEPVPFPAAVYLLNTGQNLSHNPVTPAAQHHEDYRIRIAELIEGARVELTPEQSAEFTLPSATDSDAHHRSVVTSTHKPKAGTDIVTFGIPLFSRAAVSDWPKIERLFNATLASLYNQTDPNFRVIVASNGRPSLTVPVDERLEFIDHPRHLPQNYSERQIDAGTKRWEIAARHVELGGGNLMFVDADDLVSAKLVEFVRQARNPNGCIVTDGYVLDAATRAVAPFPLPFMERGSFHRECATCAVLNLTRSDLVDKGDDGLTRYQRIFGKGGHRSLLTEMTAEGRPPLPIPFPASVYVLNTGQNMSHNATSQAQHRDDYRIRVTEHVERSRVELSPEQRAEFTLPPERDNPSWPLATSTQRPQDGTDIVTFAIPLISRGAAQDWPKVERLFNATLASLYNQTDPNFRIIVASSGRPALTVPVDERLQFIDRPRPLPKDFDEANMDGGSKRWEIAALHVELGGGNIMFVDADDLVSSRLVEFVRQTRDPNGCIVSNGYVMNEGTGSVAPFPLSTMAPGCFQDICGTSAVLNITPEDFHTKGADGSTRLGRIYGRGHHLLLKAMLDEGRPPLAVPFPAVIYVLNNGANLSYRSNQTAEKKKAYHAQRDQRIELERMQITPELRSEFALAPNRGEQAPRLSVAISSYKRPDGLRRLLTALRPQVAGNSAREIVVVNDGSHDEAYQRVVDEFQDIVRYQPLPANVGIAKVRNASAQFARGAYLVFTDDDCEPPAYWLDWLEARLDHNPELDVVAGTTKPLSSGKPRFLERVYAHYDIIPHPWSTGRTTLFVTANLAIRRDLFWQHGGFGFGEEFPGAGEDSELANRLSRAAARTVTDFNWYVRHEVSDTLRQQMKRYWRYGYANVWMTRLTTAPESYVALIPARRRGHWKNARVEFRRLLKLSAGFAPSRVKRWASAAVATLIASAYYDGCAVAAATRRTELGL